MSFFKFLGIKTPAPEETETIRGLIQKMESLDPKVARSIALFACILCRVANTNLDVSEAETRRMEEILVRIGQLSPSLAALVVEIAKVQNRLLGGVENFLFTREFCEISTPEDRLRLLDCLFAVAAADQSIDTLEDSEIRKIADELLIERKDVITARSRFRDYLSVLK